MSPPDQWTTPWPQTLVTPLFVGGPRDGAMLERLPRWQLPLAIRVPAPGALNLVTAEFVEDVHDALLPQFGIVTYRMGPYRDAFTVEYR